LEKLYSGHVAWIDSRLLPYFRDVHDHALRYADYLETQDSLLTSALTATAAQVGMRQSEDMRRISAWVAIIAVPTMIAGIYGMNFEYMPALSWRFGYPIVILVMVAICAALHRVFKRLGWL
jgi:magnesium transporter